MKNFCEDEHYFISEDAKVYSTKSGKLRELKPRINDSGYYDIKINGKTYKIHRLVAEAYIPNPENKPQVNHKDGNKLRSVVDNLEWATNAENQIHAWANGLQPVRHAINCSFTQEEVDAIRMEYSSTKTSQRKLAEKYGVSKTTITDMLNGRYYNLDKSFTSIARPQDKRKLTFEQAQEIKRKHETLGISCHMLGKEYGVDHKTIKHIINGERYVQPEV